MTPQYTVCIVLTFTELEHARLAGAASVRHETTRDYIKRTILDQLREEYLCAADDDE